MHLLGDFQNYYHNTVNMVKIHAKQEVGQVVTGERKNQNALFINLNSRKKLNFLQIYKEIFIIEK